MRILRAADHKSMPWKNGGGVTTEIAVSPEGAGLETFDWRVSMARVDSGGPFSSFAGIDRTLCILEGEGIALEIAGREPVTLRLASEPHSFPADVSTSAELLGGAVIDLNVMTRRSAARHSVERLVLSSPAAIVTKAQATLVVCHKGSLEALGQTTVRIDPLDALFLEHGHSPITLAPAGQATLFLIHIDTTGDYR